MDDFDIAQSKIGESAQRVVDRAIEESRRRDHALLTNEHVFLAFAQVEWDTFSQVMRDLELNPHEILQELEEHLHVLPTYAGRVYGRDKEIQQVLEILCHRERSNSVMLIGEPGVGKTAIVEGLARRIEFEPDTVPVRLRDCQVVNLQMNTMVAGTMLRVTNPGAVVTRHGRYRFVPLR